MAHPVLHKIVTQEAKVVSLARALDCIVPYSEDEKFRSIFEQLKLAHAEASDILRQYIKEGDDALMEAGNADTGTD